MKKGTSVSKYVSQEEARIKFDVIKQMQHQSKCYVKIQKKAIEDLEEEYVSVHKYLHSYIEDFQKLKDEWNLSREIEFSTNHPCNGDEDFSSLVRRLSETYLQPTNKQQKLPKIDYLLNKDKILRRDFEKKIEKHEWQIKLRRMKIDLLKSDILGRMQSMMQITKKVQNLIDQVVEDLATIHGLKKK